MKLFLFADKFYVLLCSLKQKKVLLTQLDKNHYENVPVKYRNWSQNSKISLEIFDNSLSFAQNIGCWYTLEPPRARWF